MLYGTPRPYWADDEIHTSNCQLTFDHPGKFEIICYSLVYYGFYYYQKRTFKKSKKNYFLNNQI